MNVVRGPTYCIILAENLSFPPSQSQKGAFRLRGTQNLDIMLVLNSDHSNNSGGSGSSSEDFAALRKQQRSMRKKQQQQPQLLLRNKLKMGQQGGNNNSTFSLRLIRFILYIIGVLSLVLVLFMAQRLESRIGGSFDTKVLGVSCCCCCLCLPMILACTLLLLRLFLSLTHTAHTQHARIILWHLF